MKEFLRANRNQEGVEQFAFLPEKDGSINGLQWENKNEFRLNGQMYDVVEKRIENGRVIISCINDKREAALIKDYENARKDDFGSSSSKRPMTFLKLMTSLFTIPIIVEPGKPLIGNSYPSAYNKMFIPSRSIEVLSPPPQIL